MRVYKIRFHKVEYEIKAKIQMLKYDRFFSEFSGILLWVKTSPIFLIQKILNIASMATLYHNVHPTNNILGGEHSYSGIWFQLFNIIQ